MPKVMIDAGHHGKYYNPSPVVDGYYESQMAWDLQGYLKTPRNTRRKWSLPLLKELKGYETAWSNPLSITC